MSLSPNQPERLTARMQQDFAARKLADYERQDYGDRSLGDNAAANLASYRRSLSRRNAVLLLCLVAAGLIWAAAWVINTFFLSPL